MSLHPTKTRMALLQAVADGAVYDLPDDDRDTIATFDTSGAEWGEPARRVTARIDEFVRAGWVAIAADDMTWSLSGEGRRVLGGAS